MGKRDFCKTKEFCCLRCIFKGEKLKGNIVYTCSFDEKQSC